MACTLSPWPPAGVGMGVPVPLRATGPVPFGKRSGRTDAGTAARMPGTPSVRPPGAWSAAATEPFHRAPPGKRTSAGRPGASRAELTRRVGLVQRPPPRRRTSGRPVGMPRRPVRHPGKIWGWISPYFPAGRGPRFPISVSRSVRHRPESTGFYAFVAQIDGNRQTEPLRSRLRRGGNGGNGVIGGRNSPYRAQNTGPIFPVFFWQSVGCAAAPRPRSRSRRSRGARRLRRRPAATPVRDAIRLAPGPLSAPGSGPPPPQVPPAPERRLPPSPPQPPPPLRPGQPGGPAAAGGYSPA